jgi:competence protein ComEA
MAALAFNAPTALAQASKPMVNVNTADVKTLQTLPGITPTLAQKIVDGRPYNSLDDLSKVKGLGKTKLNGIKDQVTFGGAATTTTPSTTKSKSKTAKASKTATNETATASGKSTTAKSSKTMTPTGSAAGKLAPGEQININTASAEELQRLPGIGATKAQSIVDYRTQHGNFQSVEDLQNVKGIKSGTLSKLKDYIKVGN